jgi:hypothetical protein
VRKLALLAVLALLAGCGGDEEAVELPLGKQISAKATFEPTVQLFAEPVAASLEVVVDRDRLDPERVLTTLRFAPYDVLETTREREDRGRFTVLRSEYTLRCVRIACIPEILPSAAGADETGRGERRSFSMPPAQIRYDEGGDEARTLIRATWPELVSVSRIKQSDVPQYGFVFKTNVTPLPDADYRAPPALLGLGLAGAALALLALPVGLGIRWWHRRRPPPLVEEEPELLPLERALRLVEWARERQDGAERREALEVLAVELDLLERAEQAEAARVLAWSPGSPSPEAADGLVRSVREPDEG